MTTDRVIQELRTLAVPGALESRERTLAVARSAYERRERVQSPHRRSRRLAIAATSVAVVVAISLTPAGHAATGWVSELVGLTHIPENHPPRGHIGGRPTDPTGFGFQTPYPQIIIGKATTPWGQPYELSVSRSPQGKYGTCIDYWSPRTGQPTAQKLAQCTSEVNDRVIGPVCVANDSGCGAAHHRRKTHTWTSPAIATASPDVERVRVRPKTPGTRVQGIRVLHLRGKFKYQVGAPQPTSVILFFVTHPAHSAVRLNVTALDKKDRILRRKEVRG
jgi:hypothetical protein